MYLTILSVMEAFPAFFEDLSDLDQGLDPSKVETPLRRDRIQRAATPRPTPRATRAGRAEPDE